MENDLQVGDRVKYSRSFVTYFALYTGEDLIGKVGTIVKIVEPQPLQSSYSLTRPPRFRAAQVKWSDGFVSANIRLAHLEKVKEQKDGQQTEQ